MAGEYETVLPEVEAKAVVQFRPHGGWGGEFGFDWMRAEDTDVAYKTNVGRYGAIHATKPGAVFAPGKYTALENE